MNDAFTDFTLARFRFLQEGEKRRILHDLERDILNHPRFEDDPRCVIATVFERWRDSLKTPERAR